jgi:hypothetical protein
MEFLVPKKSTKPIDEEFLYCCLWLKVDNGKTSTARQYLKSLLITWIQREKSKTPIQLMQ